MTLLSKLVRRWERTQPAAMTIRESEVDELAEELAALRLSPFSQVEMRHLRWMITHMQVTVCGVPVRVRGPQPEVLH